MSETTTGMAGRRRECDSMPSSRGRRRARVNMIAGYRDGHLIDPFTLEGSCNRIVFETWLETCLIPTLQPGQWVILDNATFHHGGRIRQLIEAADCQLLYLPPDSPDLNRRVVSYTRRRTYQSDFLVSTITTLREPQRRSQEPTLFFSCMKPPCSPDLNRIEKCWAWLKSRIRKQLRDSDNLRDAMKFVLEQAAS